MNNFNWSSNEQLWFSLEGIISNQGFFLANTWLFLCMERCNLGQDGVKFWKLIKLIYDQVSKMQLDVGSEPTLWVAYLRYENVLYFLRYELFSSLEFWSSDIRRTESDAYEPTVHMHSCAQKRKSSKRFMQFHSNKMVELKIPLSDWLLHVIFYWSIFMLLTPSVTASPLAPSPFFFCCPAFCFFCFLLSSWSMGAGFTNGIFSQYPKIKRNQHTVMSLRASNSPTITIRRTMWTA